jgi:hypothetical protein
VRHVTLIHGVLVLALGWGACGTDSPGTPLTPSPLPLPVVRPPPPKWPADYTLMGVSLSGVVYELTPTGRTPIAGAIVYCEPCGEGTHTFANADDNGFYHFSGDLATGGGVWVAAGFPTGIIVGLYNKDYQDPPGLPVGPAPGSREVLIDGDTTFDIELVRRAVANP